MLVLHYADSVGEGSIQPTWQECCSLALPRAVELPDTSAIDTTHCYNVTMLSDGARLGSGAKFGTGG